MPIDAYQGLWHEFAVESDEHLARIEPLLVQAEASIDLTTADMVATLFRDMHSIKGMASALALRGMERLAHHAEHLLGQVREGRCPLESSLVSVLLEAFDELKRLRAIAVATQADAPVAEAVMARIDSVRGLLEGRLPLPPASFAAPLPVSEATAGDDPPPLHPDREALARYVAALRPELPHLAHLIGPELESPAVRATIRAALHVIRCGAEALAFPQMIRTAVALADLIPAEGHLDYGRREQAIDGLAQLRREVATLEQATGDDGGGQALDDSLNAALSLDYTARRRVLLDILKGFERNPASLIAGSEEIIQAAALAGDIYNHFSFLYNANAGHLLLMIENVLDHAAHGHLALTPDLLALVHRTLIHLAPKQGQPLADSDAIAAEAIAAFEAAISTATATTPLVAPDGSEDWQAEDDQLFATLAVTPDLLDRLTPAQRHDIADQVRTGVWRLWEILAALEEAEDKAARFAAWLEDATHPLTSCAVVGSPLLSFRFLVLTAVDDTAVLAALAGIDPDGRMLTARRCGAPPAPPPTQAPTSEPEEAPKHLDTSPLPPPPIEAPRPKSSAPIRHMVIPDIGNVLRVPGEVVDHFLSTIGETVMAAALTDDAVWGEDHRGRQTLDLKRLVRSMRAHGGADPGHLDALQRYAAAQDSRNRALRRTRDRLAVTLGRLQEAALELRVVPVESVLSRLPRLARDLAASHGKHVRLDVDGGDVRIDKGMVDQLLDPLIHMVRNAIDHGIESPDERRAAGKPAVATLSVRADQRENRVSIEVSDDGRGLNAEAIRARAVERRLVGEVTSRLMREPDLFRLILLPGFSTTDTITEISGRGVGMDVVHTSVTRLGGVIDIRSRLGYGTTFILRLPLSAAIQDVLLVEADGQLHALPMRHLLELGSVGPGDIQVVHGQPVMMRHGAPLPLHRLTSLLKGGTNNGGPPVPELPIVVLGLGQRRLGVQVDRVVRRQELFVRDIHPRIAAIPGIGGAAVLSDGRVALIIDGSDLFQLAQTREAPLPLPQTPPDWDS